MCMAVPTVNPGTTVVRRVQVDDLSRLRDGLPIPYPRRNTQLVSLDAAGSKR